MKVDTIINLAVTKAKQNGYQIKPLKNISSEQYEQDYSYKIVNGGYVSITPKSHADFNFYEYDFETLIFNHDFAKAFFGKAEYLNQLKNLVALETIQDRINYLKQYIV